MAEFAMKAETHQRRLDAARRSRQGELRQSPLFALKDRHTSQFPRAALNNRPSVHAVAQLKRSLNMSSRLSNVAEISTLLQKKTATTQRMVVQRNGGNDLSKALAWGGVSTYSGLTSLALRLGGLGYPRSLFGLLMSLRFLTPTGLMASVVSTAALTALSKSTGFSPFSWMYDQFGGRGGRGGD